MCVFVEDDSQTVGPLKTKLDAVHGGNSCAIVKKNICLLIFLQFSGALKSICFFRKRFLKEE